MMRRRQNQNSTDQTKTWLVRKVFSLLLTVSKWPNVIGQVAAFFVQKYNLKKVIYLINQSYSANEKIHNRENTERLTEIDELDQIISANLSSIHFWLVVIFQLLIIFFIIYVFTPETKTKISVNLKASAFDIKVANSQADSTQSIELGIVSGDSMLFKSPTGKITSAPYGFQAELTQSLSFLPMDKERGVELNMVRIPDNADLIFSNPSDTRLNLIINGDSSAVKKTKIEWWLSFKKINLGYTGQPLRQFGADTGGIQEFHLEDSIGTGKNKIFTFSRYRPWKLKSRLFIKSIHFNNPKFTKGGNVSSLLSGSVNFLETNDSTYHLNERDVIDLSFTDKAEVFINGNQDAMNVNFEGEVSALSFGPQLLGHKSRMPKTIKTLNDTVPYVLGILTLLVPFLHSIVNRKKG